jgi:protein SDA1
MSLLSRLISAFQLDFDQFFGWVSRWLRPSHENVTHTLALVASAVHRLTSVDTLTELLRTIADRFVADHLDEEVIVVGLNTIREICARNPDGMTEELAGDLVQYKRSDVKGVVVAARGIIQLLKETSPGLLRKRDRGRPEEEVDEETLREGARVRKRTKEEKLEVASQGKSEHKFHSRMEEKEAGFSDREKLKMKPFMLTRFRKDAGHMKLRSLNAIQKAKKKREGLLKMKQS